MLRFRMILCCLMDGFGCRRMTRSEDLCSRERQHPIRVTGKGGDGQAAVAWPIHRKHFYHRVQMYGGLCCRRLSRWSCASQRVTLSARRLGAEWGFDSSPGALLGFVALWALWPASLLKCTCVSSFLIDFALFRRIAPPSPLP